jgi:predicted amidophosphoribosyltransferase
MSMGENIYELRDGVKIRTITKPFCNRCSKPISEKEGYMYCNDCFSINDLLRVNAVSLYLKWHRDVPNSISFCDNYPTNKAIMKLKKDPVQAEVLGECMVDMIKSEYKILKEIDLIVPVPAGTTERGFNQSALLAKYISDNVGMTFKDILLDKGKKMFSWDKIPGMDNVIFIDFLTQRFGIDWAKDAKIEKINNDKTIKLSTETNFLSLKLNEKETEVILEIGDVLTDKFKAKWENDELNIYCKKNPQHLTPYEDKAENVEGTIDCKEDLRGESVLLIDDVCTSGSTLKECASVLKRYGAGEIREFVFAKEVSIKHISVFINQGDKYL